MQQIAHHADDAHDHADCKDGKTWARASDRRELQEVVDDAGGELQWCWLDLPLPLAIERVKADHAHPAPDRDAELVRRVAARFEDLPASAWRLDATQPTDQLLQQLLMRLALRLNAILIDDA